MSLVNLFDTGDIAIYNYHTHTTTTHKGRYTL